ncbi:MAG: hypothetical protein AABZ60_10000 [Planctomycetota bacterium]
MRRKMNTERIERLARDTQVLSKVIDHLMEELFSTPPLAAPHKKERSLDHRLSRFFEPEE